MLLSKSLLLLSLVTFRSSNLFYVPLLVLFNPIIRIIYSKTSHYHIYNDPFIMYFITIVTIINTIYVYLDLKISNYITNNENDTIVKYLITIPNEYIKMDMACDNYVKIKALTYLNQMLLEMIVVIKNNPALIEGLIKSPHIKIMFNKMLEQISNNKNSISKKDVFEVMQINVNFLVFIKNLIKDQDLVNLLEEKDLYNEIKDNIQLTENKISTFLLNSKPR